MNENVEKPSRNVERKIYGAVPLSGSAPKVNGVSFGSRPILHPNVGKICAVTVLLTNQPTDSHWQNHNIYCWGENCLQTLRNIMYCIQWDSKFINKYCSFQPGVKMFTTYCKIYAVCVCTGGFKFPHYIELVLFCLLIGFQTSCGVTNAGGPHVKLRFKLSSEKLYPHSADEYANKLRTYCIFILHRDGQTSKWSNQLLSLKLKDPVLMAVMCELNFKLYFINVGVNCHKFTMNYFFIA